MASSFTNIIHSISKAVKGDDSESGTLNGELESHSKAELRVCLGLYVLLR